MLETEKQAMLRRVYDMGYVLAWFGDNTQESKYDAVKKVLSEVIQEAEIDGAFDDGQKAALADREKEYNRDR